MAVSAKLKRSFWKKIGIGMGAVFVLFFVAAIAIPLFVDVDKYRPEIISLAEEHINGKLELGKLTLSLWGQVKVNVDGFSLSDSKGARVVAAQDVYFHVPFTSILTGSPSLTFRLSGPELFVTKAKDGKLNVMTLMKPDSAVTELKESPEEPQAVANKEGQSTSSKKITLPVLVTRARLGIEFLKAKLSYRDLATGLDSQVNDLNVSLKDISMSKPTQIAIWADLDTKMGATLAVLGPVRLDGTADPSFKDGQFERATIKLEFDANELDIRFGELFHKGSNVTADMVLALVATPNSVQIAPSQLRFHNAEMSMEGHLSGFGEKGSKLTHEFQLQSNDIKLVDWSALIPMLKEYELEGSLLVKADSSGLVDEPKYSARIALTDGSAKGPMLKAKPKFQSIVNISPDKVENLTIDINAPGNQLKMAGSVNSFTKPYFQFAVTSTGMDLDQLLDLPESTPKPSSASAPVAASKPSAAVEGTATSSATASGGAAPESDLDKMLDPMRKNDILKATSGSVAVNMAFVKAKGVRCENIVSQMSLKQLRFAIDRFTMGLFGGAISSNAAIALAPATPTYDFKMDVKRLSMQKAVESKMEMFKNTFLGELSFDIKGSGRSLNTVSAMKNLDASGNMTVKDGSFASIDVGRVAAEAANKALAGAGGKIPGLKGKTLKAPGNAATNYELITSNFSIKDAIFKAPDFIARSKAGQGLDLNGNTVVGLIDKSLQADWEVIDTHNVTGARDISVSQNGVDVPHVLAKGNGPVKFPIKVGGTLSDPKFDYGAVPAALVSVAIGNVTEAIKNKATAEAKNRARQELEKAASKIKAPAPVQNALKKFGGGLFGK